ncbi:MAG: cell division protein FtsW [Oscillospiraceae bacterium]|nr:cell division protein FtsW [Oscillospiraceae bacterium]
MNEKKISKTIKSFFAFGGIDVTFFALLMAIVVVGLVMLYSATYVYAYYYEGDSAYYFKRQIVWVILGLIIMLVISRINYKKLETLGALAGTGVSWLLLGIALLMPEYNGTHRYIYIRPLGFQFQPSDVAKFALILTLAAILDKCHEVVLSKKPLQNDLARKVNDVVGKPILNDSLKIIIPCGIIVLVYAGLVALGSHLSGTILMLAIGIILLFLGEVRKKWFIIGGIGGSVMVVFLYQIGLLKSYMQERITAWLDKDFEPLGARWQVNQALYAIGSGGFFGKGLGQSTLKHLYVSEPQNDMIFSIVVEELGFIGAVLILLLFALLIWRGVVIAINSPDRYGALIAMGVVFQLGVQVLLNILVATDSIPNTGISLPFFSYGGTAMVVTLAEMGFVLSISRTSKIRRKK